MKLVIQRVKESKVEDESIRDTILDLGNYCILTCAVLDLIEKHKKENACAPANLDPDISNFITLNEEKYNK